MLPEKFTLVSEDLQQRKVQEWRAWYSADPQMIYQFYHNALKTFVNAKFWSEMDAEEYLKVVHVPLANDICAVSANMLFSESPDIEASSEPVQKRLELFEKQNNLDDRLLHASEVCAALGGVYLKLDSNEDRETPILTVRYPNPLTTAEFKYGELESVEFGRQFKEGKYTYRLLEKRYVENGTLHIDYELWRGDETKKGSQAPLNETPQTQSLQDATIPGLDHIGVVYIPNRLPNMLIPESEEGVSDFATTIGLMDALDEAYTSMMRDIELGYARLFVDSELVDSENKFDTRKRGYEKVDMGAWKVDGKAKPIEHVQFELRIEEHLLAIENLIKQIVTMCGYSPRSFGLNVEGGAESGTALRIRERKSMLTRQRKARYWQKKLEALLLEVQRWDNLLKGQNYKPEEADVSIGDSVIHEPEELAKTVEMLERARAASTEVKVRMMHPEWSDEQVQNEVKLIQQQDGALPVDNAMIGA